MKAYFKKMESRYVGAWKEDILVLVPENDTEEFVLDGKLGYGMTIHTKESFIKAEKENLIKKAEAERLEQLKKAEEEKQED